MEKELGIYISELLYKNECVIIPRFGGFVARHVPAKINEDGTLVSPPSKSVLFNRNLQNNDGLLVNFIMEQRSLSYDEASALCNSFSEACEQTLFSVQRLELNEVGVFYLDQEKNIQFEPQTNVNYLIEAFGLFPLNTTPLIGEETAKIVELKDRTIVAAENNNRQKYLRIAAAAIAIPVLAIGILLSVTNDKVKNTITATFGFGKDKVYTAANYKKQDYTFNKTSASEVITDANGYAGIKLSPSSGSYVMVNVSDTISADKTAVKKILHKLPKNNSSTTGKYKIVVGCFSVQENAQRLVNQLHERKLNATLAGVNKNGLHVVSAGASNNMDEARQLLQQVRQSYPSAWLMHE
ncbi:MAG TPA: SPOR domain-containing protein [Bacteroidia bacterium]